MNSQTSTKSGDECTILRRQKSKEQKREERQHLRARCIIKVQEVEESIEEEAEDLEEV